MDSLHADLCYKPATVLREAIASREISVEELVHCFLERIEEINPGLNALTQLRAEEALLDAKKCDERKDGRDGPLFGLPLTLKGTTETLDMPTTYSSLLYKDFNPGFDAVIVQRFKKAGGIVLGKTNTPEFSLSAITDNKLYGAARNPWNPAHTVGGSSGGAGGATAAGLSPLTQGSDGGGSLRVPAASCGVFTIKPTRGRVPYAPVSYESWVGFSTNGPMARTVRDAALLLDVMSGPVVGEPYSLPVPEESFFNACDKVPSKLRLAYTVTPPHGAVSPEVKEKFLEGVQTFQSLGHEIEEASPDLTGLLDVFNGIVACNTASMIKAAAIDPQQYDQLTSNTLHLALQGFQISSADYCRLVDLSRMKSATIMTFWERYDFLLTPTFIKVAPRLDQVSRILDDSVDWGAFTYPFNMTGQPAVSLPCGWGDASRMPIGLQIIGPTASEARLLSLSAQFESARPWQDKRPL